MTADRTLEDALGRIEGSVAEALKAAAGVVRELRRARGAAASGALRDLRRALDEVDSRAQSLRDVARQLRDEWDLDERAYLESGRYTRELLEAARAEGVSLKEQDDALVGYPSIIRLRPGEAALEIDRRRERRIRPSVVVGQLRDLQTRPPRFPAERFLESLFAAYGFVVKARGRPIGAVARLVDVYRVLTLLPGKNRDYSKQEFARDVYLLDDSGVKRTRDGHRVLFPAATGTRMEGALVTVSKQGKPRVYFGIAFEPP